MKLHILEKSVELRLLIKRARPATTDSNVLSMLHCSIEMRSLPFPSRAGFVLDRKKTETLFFLLRQHFNLCSEGICVRRVEFTKSRRVRPRKWAARPSQPTWSKVIVLSSFTFNFIGSLFLALWRSFFIHSPSSRFFPLLLFHTLVFFADGCFYPSHHTEFSLQQHSKCVFFSLNSFLPSHSWARFRYEIYIELMYFLKRMRHWRQAPQ